MKESGSIDYQRRHGRPRILEPVGVGGLSGRERFIIVCGLSGANTMMVRWYANSVEDARRSFREWLSEPWQTMTTDLAGNGVENGFDFKPSQISWFNIASE